MKQPTEISPSSGALVGNKIDFEEAQSGGLCFGGLGVAPTVAPTAPGDTNVGDCRIGDSSERGP
jgi:hypothetical protein